MAKKQPNRRSIYTGPPIQHLLALLGDDNFSQTLNGTAERYLLLMDAYRPALELSEWMALRDVLNGTIIDGNFIKFGGRVLALEIEDSCLLDGLAEKWGIDGKALVAKMNALDVVSACAVCHAVEIFWHFAPDVGTEVAAKKVWAP